MERRAEQVAQTRERVLAAAMEVFAEQGARGTTMQEVARRADVSPATVTNHFASPDLLLEAVVDRVRGETRVPDGSIFVGSRSLNSRLRKLTAAMFEFFDRTTSWFGLLGAELTEVPALKRATSDYWRGVRELYAAALLDSDDETLVRATAGLVHPATFTSLRTSGLSVQESIDVVAESLVHLARARASAARTASRPAQAPHD